MSCMWLYTSSMERREDTSHEMPGPGATWGVSASRGTTCSVRTLPRGDAADREAVELLGGGALEDERHLVGAVFCV